MNNQNFGDTLKRIRESRGLSQTYLAADIVSRTSISKIENGKQEPTISNAKKLITRLDLNTNEFFYIQNDYKLDSKMQILYDFMNLSETTQDEPISKLINECKNYLSNTFDVKINSILIVLESLQNFEKGYDLSTLYENLKPVWERLSKLDDWLIIDLFLINNILYFFPIDTASNMAIHALKTIKSKYPHLLKLKNAFYLNLSFLFLQKNLKDNATEYLFKSIEICKITHRYDLLLLAKIRLSICNKDLTRIREFCELLTAIEATNLVQGVKREVKYFLNIDLSI
ncbi:MULTISPECIES: helix-turn-helix domain-containing protein [Bacillus cereus group]|nr:MULTISPECIES: helix-turn-helix transcriptional regulator [Bacillus cereus group]MCU5326255.1 helix-turn-helix domain-containing protein [Bacillus cereus]MDA1845256.1 helix-turn-helix transcriptional regulator [Bacillus cereus]BCB36038.1 transcriptional regulator [Bacillus cereus]BCB98850.1 transcriptional regulator [Bacillus cereus]BCC33954.1 transcriptional regulator [Bacillus cereus]